MKMIKFLPLLIISFMISCESAPVDQNNEDQKQEEKTEQTSEKKEKKKSKPQFEDDDRVSGYFDLNIDGKTYKSTQLQDNYCDMTFLYRGDDSFVGIRFKDVESDDALLLTFYGDEEFMLGPTGTIEDFMFSKADRKVNLQFIPGDGKGAMSSTTMVKGSLVVSEFSKGHVEATFKGYGALPKDAMTQENLIPFEGEVVLETKNISEMGKEKEE